MKVWAQVSSAPDAISVTARNRRLIQGVLAHDLPQRSLRDLVDGRADVLNRDDRLHRVDHTEVSHRGHVDADVVPSDNALGLDRHRDDPERHPVQHVNERDDEPEARIPRAPHPAQPEQHPLLVLLHDPRRQGHAQYWPSNPAAMRTAIHAMMPIADSFGHRRNDVCGSQSCWTHPGGRIIPPQVHRPSACGARWPVLLRIAKNSGPCHAATNVSRMQLPGPGATFLMLLHFPGFSHLAWIILAQIAKRLAFSGVRGTVARRAPPRLDQPVHRCAQLGPRRVRPALPRPVTRW